MTRRTPLPTFRRLFGVLLVLGALAPAAASAQVAPDTTRADTLRADSTRRDTTLARPDSAAADSAALPAVPARPSFAESPAELRASLSSRGLEVHQAGQVVRTYRVAIGRDAHPTPRGSFQIRRIVWNPSWTPPDAAWARNRTAKGPGERGNPMKVVKIFFRQPDYYIHGTGDLESLGTAASHGCLRMDPQEAAELAQMVMESGGSSFGWDTIRRWLRVGSSRAITLKRPVTLVIEG